MAYSANHEYEMQIRQLVTADDNSASSRISRLYSHLKDYIVSLTAYLDEFFALHDVKLKLSTRIWYLLFGCSAILRCLTCNSPIVKNISCNGSYVPKFCCRRCSSNDDTVKLKIKDTKLNRHGSLTWNNSNKAIATRRMKNDGQYDSIETKLLKSKNTSLRNIEVRLKGLISKKLKYGDENFNNREKAKKTYALKTGYDNPSLNPEVIHKKELTTMANYGVTSYLLSNECKQKSVEVCLSRYGSMSWILSDACKAMFSDKVAIKKMKEKEYVTKKRNNSFNSSVPEDQAFLMLKFIFPHVQRLYRSDSYPFLCDFYVPEMPDMRFEFNGSWTHGTHPFNHLDENDVAIAEKWRLSDSKYYNNAFKTWTERDPHKREVAKKNGITLVEFWNIDEVRDYVISFFN